jgi:Helix-turn-helix domain
VEEDPLADLAVALRHLHRRAGEPSSREIGRAINFSHTTVAQALSGRRCPSWRVIEAVVIYLNGETEEFRELWMAVRQTEDPLPPAKLSLSQLGQPGPSGPSEGEGRAIPHSDDRVELSWDRGSGTFTFSGPDRLAWEWVKRLETGWEEGENESQ